MKGLIKEAPDGGGRGRFPKVQQRGLRREERGKEGEREEEERK